jgi:hypothetical protein
MDVAEPRQPLDLFVGGRHESALITGADPDSSHPGPPSEASQIRYGAGSDDP